MPPKAKPKADCGRCNKVSRLTRGYCRSCYILLRRHGQLSNLEVLPLPTRMTRVQEEVLVGSLLGDGGLFRLRATHSPKLSITRTTADRRYLEWQAEVFRPFLMKGIQDRDVFDERTQKTYHSSVLTTRAVPLFTSWYENWYPNGVKHIPADLCFSSLALAVWFADDGNISRASAQASRGNMKLKLATHSFPREEVERLCSMLSKRYDGSFSPHRDGETYHIYSGGSSLQAFIEEIAPHLPPGMERKAYWSRPEVLADPPMREERQPWFRQLGLHSPDQVEEKRQEFIKEAVLLYRDLKSLRKVGQRMGKNPATIRRWLKVAGEDIRPPGRTDGQLDWGIIHSELEAQVRAAPPGATFKAEDSQTALGQAICRGIRALATAGLLQRVKPGIYIRV